MRLILVRHGETGWNADGRIQGHLNVPLSERGRDQARRLALRFRAACDPVNPRPLSPCFGQSPFTVTAQYSSDLDRAHETGRIVQSAVPSLGRMSLRTTELLRERNFGEWQGVQADELRARRSIGGTEPPNGESEAQVFDRVCRAIHAIATNALSTHITDVPATENILVYGHGGSLRAFLCAALGLGAEHMRRFRLENTSLSVVEISASVQRDTVEVTGGKILCVNDTAHLIPTEIFTGE